MMINRVEVHKRLESLLERYNEIFQEVLGAIKTFEAKLQLKDEAKPNFHKAPPVPLALKQAIGEELDRLETEGIIEKVEFSE